MDLSNGQRIEVTFGGTPFHGHVYEDRLGKSVLLDDWKLVVPNDWSSVRASAAPPVPGSPGHRKWGRGDRIEFSFDGSVHHGTVASADLMGAEVIRDGERDAITIPCRQLSPSAKPSPANRATVMRSWSVASHRSVPGRGPDDREGFVAAIAKDGVVVAKAYDAGHGRSHLEGPTQPIVMLQEMAAAWVLDSGAEHLDPSAHGGVDLWLDWEMNHRPLGIDPHAFLRTLDDAVAEAAGLAGPRGP